MPATSAGMTIECSVAKARIQKRAAQVDPHLPTIDVRCCTRSRLIVHPGNDAPTAATATGLLTLAHLNISGVIAAQ